MILVTDGTNVARAPVTQLMLVVVLADTTHAMPSIVTLTLVLSAINPVPVNVTAVPPAVVPKAGDTD